MYIFWNNISKFPRFFISVLMGFFLTIFNPFFELLRNPKQGFLFIIIISMTSITIWQILKLMLALN
uniref:Uncharacterized protein ycf33 n=1 Tax=Calliarthron tuberculosum TaxID=48942 RepID=M4IV61_CALTB|nr:conserved hypothetical plastid protein [Calliarthron tuberculosum]AGA63802.1 conserved hypothetical plastid protein [Calliarthron tuberculosum]